MMACLVSEENSFTTGAAVDLSGGQPISSSGCDSPDRRLRHSFTSRAGKSELEPKQTESI